MSKFFVESEQINGNTITIVGEDAYHIYKVLRMQVGDTLTVCDGNGTDHLAKIKEISKQCTVADIVETFPSVQEPAINVVLFQGLPKSDKMDYIIQKCVELGIARIVPITTVRTIVRLKDKQDVKKKVQRWNKISEEASKQCNRGMVPIVDEPLDLSQAAFEAAKLDFCFVLYEEHRQYSIKDILNKARDSILNSRKSNIDIDALKPSIGFFVGPEGGFEKNEIELLQKYNILPASLGTRILRTETAGVCAISCIMYEFDELC